MSFDRRALLGRGWDADLAKFLQQLRRSSKLLSPLSHCGLVSRIGSVTYRNERDFKRAIFF